MSRVGQTRPQPAGEMLAAAGRWLSRSVASLRPGARREAVIGLALGGGFARGIAHVGVLRVFEREGIPIQLIAGVSAGSMVAAAFASGANSHDIEAVAKTMKFRDVGRWTVSRYGLVDSERMIPFLKRLLKAFSFEQMRIPLAVVATDLTRAKAAVFRDQGDVVLPIRASCSYPGLFLPIEDGNRLLVDGAMTMEVPALPLRQMGATHVISVALPVEITEVSPRNMFAVVNRCFQIMQHRTENEWRRHSNLVISPDVRNMAWDGFESADQLIQAGERAATAALPRILSWLGRPAAAPAPSAAPLPSPSTP